MSQTRQQLDRKIARLEERARELSPRRYAREHMPEFIVDRAIGGLLVVIGLTMTWRRLRARRLRRAEVRDALLSYGRS